MVRTYSLDELIRDHICVKAGKEFTFNIFQDMYPDMDSEKETFIRTRIEYWYNLFKEAGVNFFIEYSGEALSDDEIEAYLEDRAPLPQRFLE